MRLRIRKLLSRLWRLTEPPAPDQRATIKILEHALAETPYRVSTERAEYMERVAELIEAQQMSGAGPWHGQSASVDAMVDRVAGNYGQPVAMRESSLSAQGAFGDIEMALQNVEWRREINLSWLEFSRWGIQQMILICRLYYIKNPWIRRGITLSAAYVFGQGVELSSPDLDANEVLTDFRERNRMTLGQIALVEQEKRKSYDGNLFWCLFADTQDTGEVNVRLIDATEIQEIVADPDDASVPQFYRRTWTQRAFNVTSGQYDNTTGDQWYPALHYEPLERPASIGGKPVNWDQRIHHRKVGHVANWQFGAPRVYSALDWCKEGKRLLTACASVIQAQAQIALTITTKGGQQALAGLKQQFGTTVSPDGTNGLWDGNPPAVAGSTFATGPGTTAAAFKTRGTGTDPTEIREFRNMAACSLEIPPTWLGDMETSNLSTAQTLDRPTELGFLLKQEEWQEDLVVMGKYALAVSLGAVNGKLREAYRRRGAVQIREARRVVKGRHWVYEAAKARDPKTVEVLVTFPAIREGDIPQLVKATNDAMAIDRQGNQHGIDDRTAFRQFCVLLDVPNAEELTEKVYPKDTYNHDRTKEPDVVAVPPPPHAGVPPTTKPTIGGTGVIQESERIRRAMLRVESALRLHENGTHAEHAHR